MARSTASRIHPALFFSLCLVSGLGLSACSPTVKIEAPDKPIVINMNIKIEQEILVKMDREADRLIEANPDLF